MAGYITIFLLTCLTSVLTLIILKSRQNINALTNRNKELLDKYHPVVSVEAKVEEIKQIVSNLHVEQKKTEENIKKLIQDQASESERLKAIKKEASIYDETLELAEWGYYKPHFKYGDSENFQRKIEENRSKQKELLNLELNRLKVNSVTTKQVKLPDYAFNRECDSAIANTNWKNGLQMEERIHKAFNFINKNNNGYVITQDILNLKIEELRLNLEYQLKKNEEKEEQKRIKMQMQEEERDRRAIEKVKDEAEREEQLYLKELSKAQKDLGKAHAEERDLLAKRILELESKLVLVGEQKERALSMAQQTKRGHVYIISNIGSFGENVFKIGMTRRLDPQDRVDELGDASVPFEFDVHGMIYSEDAPGLENQLHKLFGEHTVNKINSRKEFFKVSIQEIQKECTRYGLDIELTKIAEARDYRQSIDMKSNPYKKVA